MTENDEAPKRRGRKPKAETASNNVPPPATAPPPAPVPEPDDDGPGIYKCIRKCIGGREYRPGDKRFFSRNPGKNYFAKVQE